MSRTNQIFLRPGGKLYAIAIQKANSSLSYDVPMEDEYDRTRTALLEFNEVFINAGQCFTSSFPGLSNYLIRQGLISVDTKLSFHIKLKILNGSSK